MADSHQLVLDFLPTPDAWAVIVAEKNYEQATMVPVRRPAPELPPDNPEAIRPERELGYDPNTNRVIYWLPDPWLGFINAPLTGEKVEAGSICLWAFPPEKVRDAHNLMRRLRKKDL